MIFIPIPAHIRGLRPKNLKKHNERINRKLDEDWLNDCTINFGWLKNQLKSRPKKGLIETRIGLGWGWLTPDGPGFGILLRVGLNYIPKPILNLESYRLLQCLGPLMTQKCCRDKISSPMSGLMGLYDKGLSECSHMLIWQPLVPSQTYSDLTVNKLQQL